MSVLVVDDQPLNRILLGRLLRSLDLHVIEAGDGQAGLQAYLSHGRAAVSMVFMDLMMPVLDGIQAVLSIRSAESLHGWQPVPIVAFTSEDVAHGSPLWHECMDSGFDDVVSKPVNKRYATQLLCRFMPGLHPGSSPSKPPTGGCDGGSSGSGSEMSSDDEVACACGERSGSCSKCGSSSQLADAAGAAVSGTATSQRASFGGSAFGGSALGGRAFGGSGMSCAGGSSSAFGGSAFGGNASGGTFAFAGTHAYCSGSDGSCGPNSYANSPPR